MYIIVKIEQHGYTYVTYSHSLVGCNIENESNDPEEFEPMPIFKSKSVAELEMKKLKDENRCYKYRVLPLNII